MLRLKEIRSILPPNINVMALTATATKLLRVCITKLIGLRNPFIISMSPCKKTLKYCICKIDMESMLQSILIRLCEERANCPRTIIYCRSFEDC